MRTLTLFALLLILFTAGNAQRINFDADWKFTYGHAQNPEKDFGCGTEYFNYLTKANSGHDSGPYGNKFNASEWPNKWVNVTLPHDWVVDLPFSGSASHSHGYKQVGWKWPETSIGWYRKEFILDEADKGKHFEISFDGIFRHSQIWVNGFYLGLEQSGYVSQNYDITDYLVFDSPNFVTVRVDASLEEGWFYEGAGIYRHVWLVKSNPVHITPYGVFAQTTFPGEDFNKAVISVLTEVVNDGREKVEVSVKCSLLDEDNVVISKTQRTLKTNETKGEIAPRAHAKFGGVDLPIDEPKLWDTKNPYLYTVRTEVVKDREVIDSRDTKIGLRQVVFDENKGLILNGEHVKITGVCNHQDHAGVGAGIPDGLQVYRLQQLKKLGVNGYRASHNPMTPALIDACDSLGILVIEENRLTGINDYQIGQLENMIMRDRNHPSIIAWSMGNEEWGIEWNNFGTEIVHTMVDYAHLFDPTRPTAIATSGGPTPLIYTDISGYNYLIQNPIDEHHKNYPKRKALGTEETTGCGTRGVYFHESGEEMPHKAEDQYDEFFKRNPSGRMPSFNLCEDKDSTFNRIERGWQFYAERDWLAGLFYWTGFDYRGEPNPLGFPATNSEFGILDYCGFPKDEAYYLKSWWTDEPVLHIFPHWNLKGHEGEEIELWAYSNCDEVELFVNGKSLGKQAMPKNGHLSWNATYTTGKVRAVGYKKGSKVLTETIETTGEAVSLKMVETTNGDITVVDIFAQDKDSRFVPDANNITYIEVDGEAEILGVGNGDPAWQAKERPLPGEDKQHFSVALFNGCAQVIVKNKSSIKISFQEIITNIIS